MRSLFLAALLLSGCTSRRVAVVAPEYDPLSDETPTMEDLRQAAQDAIASICKLHPRARGCQHANE